MKNKYISFVTLAAAALATSCASDDLAEQKQEQTEPRTVTLTASVNEGQTRVGMTKDGTTASFYWHSSDKILVQTKNGSTYSGAEFSTTANTGDKTASFTGEIGADYEIGTYAVYPYDSSNQKHSFTGEKAMTYNLPSSYTNYTPGNNIFSKTTDGNTTYPSNPTNMPMLGTITDGKISFKCLGGLAVIRIEKMPAAEGTLTVTADQQLSGDFSVDLSADEAQIATTSENVSDDNKKVTFTFNGASSGNVGVFYLPLATGGYSNVTIEITYGGTTQTVKYGSLSVARKSVTAIPLYATGTNGALTKFSKIDDNVYTINGHEFIDLGLESGLLWATMNVGATEAKGAGNYYAWGEVAPKEDYTEQTYAYQEAPSTIDAAHDAATVNWGAGVRMPTKEEFKELYKNCSWEVDYTVDEGENVYTIYGMTVTSKKSDDESCSIYIPTAGVYNGTTLIRNTGKFSDIKGDCAFYWSSTLMDNSRIGGLSFSEDKFMVQESETPAYGCSVRAVAEKP